MEAVPRLPMISFHLKVSSEPTAFGPKLKQYIRDFYNEDAESYNNEIHQLESLRAMAVRPPIDMAGCLLLKKYYCQLHFLQSRFPMGKDGIAAVTFKWRDTYANVVHSIADIRLEIISILYNIGSMHTQLGARTERTSADGMKMACAHFQCAAWAFEHLKNNYLKPSCVELTAGLMTFIHPLCLAQAQECILEKSMLDNRKPTIVAKVARQIVDYFTMALTTLEQDGSDVGSISDTVGTKIYKAWKRYVKFKRAYHLAVTHLYQGLAAEEQRKMGERVAFYNAALASLNEAHAIYTNAKGSIGITGASEEKTAVEEALTFTNDVIEGKRKAAKNENEFIYHEEVPEKDTLPTVKGASLVKGISFSINDPEVSGPDIFARLVPMKVHEASSLYSEEKAKILRSVGGKIEEKDQQLNTYLASLKLENMSLWDPDAQTSEWERLPLPDDLVERCAALNAKQHIIQDLVDIMAKLSDTSHDVETILKEIKELLLDEEKKEKEYQDTVGKRPPSIVATDLTREAKKYEEAHNKASESNHALHKAITMHVKNLKILAQPLADLVTHIPSPTAFLAEQSNEKTQSAIELEQMHTKELKRILNKVDEMRRQRSDLHTKLRDSIAQDDLTRLLVTATSESGPLDHLFADQLSKHQTLVGLIGQNIAAQDNILAALTDAYAHTANIRKGVEETLKRRELTISSLIASYDAYEDLLAKSNKGLEFYRKLEINVSKLLQRVKSTCKVQEEEREHILAQDKSSYDKVDTKHQSPAHEQGHTRTGSGLKLKDYLNNRTESVSNHQNQYYNIYKGQTGSLQADAGTKIYANPVTDKTSVTSSNVVPMSDASSTYMKPMQQYYPSTYADFKATPAYSYGTHSYDGSTSIGNYMPVSNSVTTSVYQHIPIPAAVATGVINTTMQYPSNSFVTNGQSLQPTMDSQDKSTANTQSQYNMTGSTVQYDAYQAVDYAAYIRQYGAHSDKATVIIQNDATESLTQSHAGSQPTAIISTAMVNNTESMDGQVQHAYSAIHQGQQYMPEAQQKVVNSQDSSHNIIRNPQLLPSGSNPSIQNYTVSQTNQNKVPYSQSYQGNMYYNTSDVHPQQDASIYTTSGGSSYSMAAQYMVPQQTSVNPQVVHSVASVVTPVSEMPATYPANIHGVAVQHAHQTEVEQNKQTYMDKGYLSYGTQVQTSGIASNYSSTYPNYQHGTTAVPYQQGSMLPTEVSGSYPYMSCPTSSEMIQSHTKATTVQSYSQSYQYPQDQYSAYYPKSYGQEYPYMQGDAVVSSSMTETYNGQSGYAYNPTNQAQCYQYGPNNPQTTQTLQTLPAVPSTPQTISTTSDTYNQQESNARYTNASSKAMVSQTPSSQYSGQVHPSQALNDTYYTTPYGLQMQTPSSTAKTENYTNYNQTYMQAVNNGTNTTTSSDPMKLTTKSDKPTSNVDLLSDLDITINHAPLVPEVRPLNKTQTQDDSDVNDTTEECRKEGSKDAVTEAAVVVPEDKTETENLQIVWDTWYNDVQPKKDPLGDPTALQKFISEVEKYEKFVDSLLVKTLSGATNLDIKWKEVQEFEERENGKRSSTVALAHSSENRVMECIPYDDTRVQISSGDTPFYINASHVMDITQWIPTSFIITQAPLADKLNIFWRMVWDQESEVIACLVSDAQLNGEIYWPVNDESSLTVDNFVITLKRRVNHPSYIQRVMSVYHEKRKSERIIVHMQFFAWPLNGFPSSPGALIAFSTDVMTEQALRRCSPKPVIVHCLDGGALSSLFLAAAATVCHIRAVCGIVDVPLVFKGLLKCRKQVVNKESLLFAYRLVLYHAQDILMKRGILSSTRSTFENFDGFKSSREKAIKKMHQCHPSDDFLQSLNVSAQQSDIEQGNRHTNSIGGGVAHKASSHDKSTENVDPLSQLDPLWSIRR